MTILDEAARSRTPSRAPQSVPDVELTPGRLLGQAKHFAEVTSDITRFGLSIGRRIPDLRQYPSEVVRQTAVLVLSSGLIIWLMLFVIGAQCGIEGNYVLKQIGAPLYSGIFTAWCAIREMAPYMWGYILAAKVGCGLVAELGSMRISDEIDAMEVMGVDSKTYLVASRLVAALLAMPFLYIVGLGVMYTAEYLVVVVQFGEVSPGGYDFIFWLYQNPLDLVYSLTKVMAMGIVIVVVGCYYGYNARGGPIGVGRATATSMMVNMVLIHVIGVLGTMLFWGLSPNAPIAN
ncbi:MAG: transporter permease [Frankiales bacterium]|jgi:phospholipid/cholesterol/gamma-HCH transport system permease protein|nr:transporter permease [Frankiales bacterium]